MRSLREPEPSRPELTETKVDLLGDYLRYVASVPGPKIAVGWDLDEPAGLGAQFGEVTATIHQKLGCVGHITSGCPRDLDEVEALGFQLFGLNPCVSHAYVRLVDFGSPVVIAGVEIRSGDLLHADKHGVCLIPHEVASRLADACVEVETPASGHSWKSAAPTTSRSKNTSSSGPSRTSRPTNEIRRG